LKKRKKRDRIRIQQRERKARKGKSDRLFLAPWIRGDEKVIQPQEKKTGKAGEHTFRFRKDGGGGVKEGEAHPTSSLPSKKGAEKRA